MIFLGTLVNCATVIVGSTIGLVFKKGIPERIGNSLMQGLGLCTIFIGVQGAFKGENTLLMIISMVLGILIGELLDLDGKFNRAIKKIENKFASGSNTFAQGMINASLLFCIGSMTLVGAVNSGINNDHTMLYTKSTLDLFSSMIFASTLGIGVLFSSIFVLVYQGGITLLAYFAAPLLSMAAINEMTCVGSLLIIGTGLNLLGITNLKLMNYLPAMFLPLVLTLIM